MHFWEPLIGFARDTMIKEGTLSAGGRAVHPSGRDRGRGRAADSRERLRKIGDILPFFCTTAACAAVDSKNGDLLFFYQGSGSPLAWWKLPVSARPSASIRAIRPAADSATGMPRPPGHAWWRPCPDAAAARRCRERAGRARGSYPPCSRRPSTCGSRSSCRCRCRRWNPCGW